MLTAAQAKPTFGTHISYNPVEFPKVGRSDVTGQSASAKDPDHQASLESAGFKFPIFVAGTGGDGTTDAAGNNIQQYPKALFGPNGATALARDPGHEEDLKKGHWKDAPHAAVAAAVGPVHYSATPVATPNIGLDALTKEFMDLQNTYAALQADHALAVDDVGKLKDYVAEANEGLAGARDLIKAITADRDALQAKLSQTANANKAQLQKDLADSIAKHDALASEHSLLKMQHDEVMRLIENVGAEPNASA